MWGGPALPVVSGPGAWHLLVNQRAGYCRTPQRMFPGVSSSFMLPKRRFFWGHKQGANLGAQHHRATGAPVVVKRFV